jgi:hypothetical protein
MLLDGTLDGTYAEYNCSAVPSGTIRKAAVTSKVTDV